jgi:CRISPR-associated protein Cmr2
MINEKYIGITIGPILKTFEYVKDTGGLWGASYIFSYIMKNIYINLKKENFNNEIYEILLPNIEINNCEDLGVGIFHDRIILKIKKNDSIVIKKIKEIVYSEKDNFKKLISEIVEVKDDFIDNYLKLYIVETSFSEEEKQEKNWSPLIAISNYLSMVELREKAGLTFTNEDNKIQNALQLFLNNEKIKCFIKKSGSKFWEYNDIYYSKEKNNYNFPSIMNIGLEQIYHSNNEPTSELTDSIAFDPKEFKNSYKDLLNKEKSKENNNLIELKKYHNYVAIIQADGDNLGNLITDLECCKDVSKEISDFSKEAINEIKCFGALNIYAGGDDLLFIAPLVNHDNNTVFSLLGKLSEIYKNKFCDFNKCEKTTIPCSGDKEIKKTTLSFGVNIIYSRYPLFEALEKSRNLLFDKAKKFNINEKNCTAIRLTKHSGNFNEIYFGNESKIYKKFQCLIKKIVGSEEDIFESLKGINTKIANDYYYLKEILDDENLLNNYFENNFLSEINKTRIKDISKRTEILESLKSLLINMYEDNKKEKEKTIREFISILNILKFFCEGDSYE